MTRYGWPESRPGVPGDPDDGPQPGDELPTPAPGGPGFGLLNSLYGEGLSEGEISRAKAAKEAELKRRLLFPVPKVTCPAAATTTVAVIGAGFAGLMAAWYLTKAGMKVTVFEATAKVGGRVETNRNDLIPGKQLEFGAELVGTNHILLTLLVKEFGLHLAALGEGHGKKLPSQMVFGGKKLTDAEMKQLHADAKLVFDKFGEAARRIDQFEPWLSPGAFALDLLTAENMLVQHAEAALPKTGTADPLGPRRLLAIAFIRFLLENDNCAPATMQSYLGILAVVSAGRMGDTTAGMRGYWDYTETDRVAEGNDRVGTELAKALTDLRLNTPVTGLTVTADKVTVATTAPATGPVEFDYAILAAPPTVWTAITVQPGFVPAKYTMAHGKAAKFFSVFPEQVWLTDRVAPVAHDDSFGQVWEGTENQDASKPGFCLAVFTGGTFVLTSESKYVDKLGVLFPATKKPRTPPAKRKLVDWSTRAFILAGYFVPAPGQVTTVAKECVTPFKNRLYFAGEHTYVPYFGYMEGALLSGARAGRDILMKVCGLTIPEPPAEEPADGLS